MMVQAETESSSLERRGIGHWMERVLAECGQARANFDADAVHDLRVAIRRCRSMAEGFQSLDGDPTWKCVRNAGKAVFSELGELRDTQVLLEWIERLKDEGPNVAERLRAHCRQREAALKATAAQALDRFDTRRWRQWAPALEARVERVGESAGLFQVAALERWEAARVLHAKAIRNHTKRTWHELRIGIKKFRYVVENFLPDHHQRWGGDLKYLQDLLGEVHDLDVLWETACRIRAFASGEERRRWYAAIARERKRRVTAYREKMGGRHALWQEWRRDLPAGEVLRKSVLRRFAVWAATLDPDPAHARKITGFSLKLYDALNRFNLLPACHGDNPNGSGGSAGRARRQAERVPHGDAVLPAAEADEVNPRDLLQAAALAHAVGSSLGAKAYHKRSRRLLERLEVPPAWSAQDLRIAGLVARYHRGALPARQRQYAALGSKARRLVDCLAGILRLAESLDAPHHRAIRRISVAQSGGRVEILAEGYLPRSKQAEKIAAARYLCESACGVPIMMLPQRVLANRKKKTGKLRG
jgi:exopolyphosphatase/guanosine-5'-triphosphate,3'-diphosphate pyrophosphatase